MNDIRSADYSPFPSPWAFPVTQNDPLTVGFVKAETTDRPAEVKLGTVGERTGGGIFVAALDYMVHVMLLQVEGQRRKARDVLKTGEWLCIPVTENGQLTGEQ